LVAVLVAMVGLVNGATWAQETVTLTPGPEASGQDVLLSEALGAMVQAGYDPADFDFEKAVFDPLGRAVFLPVKDPINLEQLPVLIGLLYIREPIELAGKMIRPGLHRLLLTNGDTVPPGFSSIGSASFTVTQKSTSILQLQGCFGIYGRIKVNM